MHVLQKQPLVNFCLVVPSFSTGWRYMNMYVFVYVYVCTCAPPSDIYKEMLKTTSLSLYLIYM
jgi:hypothetical protein